MGEWVRGTEGESGRGVQRERERERQRTCATGRLAMAVRVRAEAKRTGGKEKGTIARSVVRVKTPVQLVRWAREEPEEAAVWLGSALGRVSGAFAGALMGAVVAGVRAAADEAKMVDVVVWDVDETGKKVVKQAGPVRRQSDGRKRESPPNPPTNQKNLP